MEDQPTVLVVAKPGRLRDALNAILLATPQVRAIENVEDSASLSIALEGSPPALVLQDTDVGGELFPITLEQVRAKWPQTRSIVIVDGIEQQRVARAAGANGTLLKGFPVTELLAVVERLLTQKQGGQRVEG